MSNQRLTVAALTGGKNDPSARFRVRQLIPALRDYNFDMHEIIPPVSKYPPSQKWVRPFWALAALCSRIPAVMASYRYDVALLQRELISSVVTIESLIKHPLVFDVDDAIFLRRGGRFAKKIAEQSDLVICGNDFLADTFCAWNKRVVVIPTAVDAERFVPASYEETERKTIGWIGSSSNFKYLYRIEKALDEVLKMCSAVYLRIIADSLPNFHIIEKDKFEFIQWSPQAEVDGIQEMTIGIMPLEDSLWERGKCGYKMLLYMSCGIPVVVSPVGMNSQILSMGEIGLAARGKNEWVDALLELLSDSKKRTQMSKNGRKIIENYFSIAKIAPILAECLRNLVL